MQCPICLRYYCERRVHPGGHVCHPVKLPEVKEKEPEPPAEPPADAPAAKPPVEPTPPREMRDPEATRPGSTGLAPKEEAMISHADVVRFMARERMNRHERKRDRWHQQMFG